MLKTLKLHAGLQRIPLQREYSSAFRFAYERLIDGDNLKVVESKLKMTHPILGCWLRRMASLDALAQLDSYLTLGRTTVVDFATGKEKFAKIFCWTPKARTNVKKREYETSQIAHSIIRLARHLNVSTISLENLTMGAKNNGKGKVFNRICNNEWNRNQFQWLIQKLSDRYGIICKLVNCAYSSTIGNILHRNLPDPCAAAKEIARRGKFQYIKRLCMYPEVNFFEIPLLNQWKEEGVDFNGVNSWKALHNKIKDSKLGYRVPLDALKDSGLRFFSRRSGIVVLYCL